MSVFFTSDQHFGHRNIIRFCARPFSGLDEMHAALVERYNARVADGDTVYHVGDFALDERLVPRFLRQLRGRKVLVSGNHDQTSPHRRRCEAAKRRYRLYGFDSVVERLELPVGGRYVHCAHLPYRGDSHDNVDRFQQFRLADDGGWLLHGHVHELWRVRDRMVNVGVDQWDFAPVSEDEVAAVIREGDKP